MPRFTSSIVSPPSTFVILVEPPTEAVHQIVLDNLFEKTLRSDLSSVGRIYL